MIAYATKKQIKLSSLTQFLIKIKRSIYVSALRPKKSLTRLRLITESLNYKNKKPAFTKRSLSPLHSPACLAASWINLLTVPSEVIDVFFWVAAVGSAHIVILFALAYVSLIVCVLSSSYTFPQLLPYRRYFVWLALFSWCWFFYSFSAMVAKWVVVCCYIKHGGSWHLSAFAKEVRSWKGTFFWWEPVIETVLVFASLLPWTPVLFVGPYVTVVILGKLYVKLFRRRRRAIQSADNSWFFAGLFSFFYRRLEDILSALTREVDGLPIVFIAPLLVFFSGLGYVVGFYLTWSRVLHVPPLFSVFERPDYHLYYFFNVGPTFFEYDYTLLLLAIALGLFSFACRWYRLRNAP